MRFFLGLYFLRCLNDALSLWVGEPRFLQTNQMCSVLPLLAAVMFVLWVSFEGQRTC